MQQYKNVTCDNDKLAKTLQYMSRPGTKDRIYKKNKKMVM